MKQGFQAEHGDVAFRDRATGRVMVTGSTLDSHGRVEALQRRDGRRS